MQDQRKSQRLQIHTVLDTQPTFGLFASGVSTRCSGDQRKKKLPKSSRPSRVRSPHTKFWTYSASSLPASSCSGCVCMRCIWRLSGRIPHNFHVPLEIWQLFLRAPCCWRSLVRRLLRQRSTGIWEISGRRGLTGTPGV